MSEGEKIQFTGNLALLRVCAIVYIVNVLNFVFNMSFMAGHGGFFSSLWSALTNSSFEDLLATVGLLIVSGIGLPVLLGVLLFVVLLALGVFAIVKNNVMVLKILAVLLLIWVFASVFIIIPIHVLMGDAVTKVDVQNFINMVFNVNVVVAVAAFFVASKKHDESGAAAAEEPFNLGLFRLCAIFFIVSGLNSLAHFVCTQSPLFQFAFFGVVNLAVGVFALAKENPAVLIAGSLMMFVKILLNWLNFIRISGLDPYMVGSLVSHAVFNTSTVIAIAVFFIKPEWVKSCLQKMKG
ncbi:MAG: hypothetical protein IKS97_10605 [Fibrobacter sp.]|nr:hypothetical protein [Fibrobacter sp.]